MGQTLQNPASAERAFDRVAIATHYYATGPAFELEEFLRPRTSELLFIAHPLFNQPSISYSRLYKRGSLATEKRVKAIASPMQYLVELVRTARWTRATRLTFDLYVGGDNLLALSGLYLRARGYVKRVVLYSIDFSPRRFKNPIANWIYHRVDRFVSGRVDAIWNVSEAITRARDGRDGAGSSAPQIVVPVGAHTSRIRRSIDASHGTQIAFMGVLLEKQGLQLVIEALPTIRASVPTSSLLVLGDGPYAGELKRLARVRAVDHCVEFTGFVESHEEIENRLAGAALGVAPYAPDETSFTRFADPGKLKVYLACGLPVIVTDVPEFAKTIEASGAGSIVPYTADAIATAAVRYLTNPTALRTARLAAAKLAESFEWSSIFETALHTTATVVQTTRKR